MRRYVSQWNIRRFYTTFIMNDVNVVAVMIVVIHLSTHTVFGKISRKSKEGVVQKRGRFGLNGWKCFPASVDFI